MKKGRLDFSVSPLIAPKRRRSLIVNSLVFSTSTIRRIWGNLSFLGQTVQLIANEAVEGFDERSFKFLCSSRSPHLRSIVENMKKIWMIVDTVLGYLRVCVKCRCSKARYNSASKRN